MSVSYRDMRRENESENHRIRNKIDIDYNDMLDIMEWEYTFSRCSRRCDVADCITFYAVSIKSRYFSIVYCDLSRKLDVCTWEHTETHGHGGTDRGRMQWRSMNWDAHNCHQSLKFQWVSRLFIWFTRPQLVSGFMTEISLIALWQPFVRSVEWEGRS
jgi:hypothetical protein